MYIWPVVPGAGCADLGAPEVDESDHQAHRDQGRNEHDPDDDNSIAEKYLLYSLISENRLENEIQR